MTTTLIGFLNALGRNPNLPDYPAAVAALAVDAHVKEALMGRDPHALNRAFGASAPYWCEINAPEDEPLPADDSPGELPDGEPDQRPGPDPAT
jgi:hypothetical protein